MQEIKINCKRKVVMWAVEKVSDISDNRRLIKQEVFMQGNHKFQPELFIQIDYQVLIPKHHLLRRIDKVLDLSFVKQLTPRFYSDTQGRPSIDPEVFFRICVLGHIYGIKSDRQLCEEIVEQCHAAGLVSGKQIITDASLVEANASLGKLGRRERQTEAVEVKDEATFPTGSLANM